jgi:hypothetical protein
MNKLGHWIDLSVLAFVLHIQQLFESKIKSQLTKGTIMTTILCLQRLTPPIATAADFNQLLFSSISSVCSGGSLPEQSPQLVMD